MGETVILAKIRAQLTSFSPAERKVAEYILAHGEFVPTMTTKQLAEQANASEASIVRFCKRIGMESFRMVKVALAQEYSQGEATINSTSLIESNDTPHSLFQKVTSLNRMSLEMAPKTISYAEFENAVTALQAAGMISIFGVGGSYTAAVDAQYKLMRLGCHATTSSDYHYMVPLVTMMKPEDVLICVSMTGRTHEIVELARFAKERKVTVLAITRLDNSPLYKLADICLCIPDIELEHRIGSIASRTSQLNIIDALYVALFHSIGAELVDRFDESRARADEHRQEE
ncbi:MurR/RpiR family transcriptional regulator [Salsuginibacillus kocurii]|uniref:MurR/RpiR family transcriptional regulator n=1 Tax=Salsuginibacillus kocurii TaxID=427078 RepID=UPI000362F94E|nr:MurR/RpiR family transcriptional regulator [Salsuginibacillus kocurii]